VANAAARQTTDRSLIVADSPTADATARLMTTIGGPILDAAIRKIIVARDLMVDAAVCHRHPATALGPAAGAPARSPEHLPFSIAHFSFAIDEMAHCNDK
jgi:hypothetical protein